MGKRIDTEEFIRRSKLVHGNKYDYSKTHYVRAKDKVCIICPKHGEFWQRPFAHFYAGGGCKKCAMEALTSNKPKTTEQFIKEAIAIHGDKYDYSKVEYNGCFEKICIICPKHGEFRQTPDSHIRGSGCPICKFEKIGDFKRKNVENFINDSKKIHEDKYDYSKVKYINTNTEVCIICPIHGKFWQKPHVHLGGCGCPRCSDSRLEKDIKKKLDELDVEYIQGKHHKWLLNEDTNYPLSLDFYSPKYKIAIECQGVQHFEPIEHFGGEDKFEYRKFLDEKKKQLCKDNGVKLIYYLEEKYNKFMKGDDIYFNNVNDLANYIQEYGSAYRGILKC